MLIEGSSGGSGQGVNPPQTSITGPASGPAFYINGTLSGLTMRNPHEHSCGIWAAQVLGRSEKCLCDHGRRPRHLWADGGAHHPKLRRRAADQVSPHPPASSAFAALSPAVKSQENSRLLCCREEPASLPAVPFVAEMSCTR